MWRGWVFVGRSDAVIWRAISGREPCSSSTVSRSTKNSRKPDAAASVRYSELDLPRRRSGGVAAHWKAWPSPSHARAGRHRNHQGQSGPCRRRRGRPPRSCEEHPGTTRIGASSNSSAASSGSAPPPRNVPRGELAHRFVSLMPARAPLPSLIAARRRRLPAHGSRTAI